LAIIVRNKFDFMPISYTLSNFREKQHINGHNPAKQAHKIWPKILKGYWVITLYVLGHFFSRTVYIIHNKMVETNNKSKT